MERSLYQVYWLFPLSLDVRHPPILRRPSKPSCRQTALVQNFNAHNHVGDVSSGQDALPASRPFHVNQLSEAIEVPVRDCTAPGLYEMEKQMALNEAAADETGKTVPVKFSYSFGKKHDALAKAANERAVLSASNPGYSYIPVGSKTKSTYNGRHAYYKADNTNIARQYSTGERCFFSTIQIDPDSYVESKAKYDFIEITDEDIHNSEELLRRKKTLSQKKSLPSSYDPLYVLWVL